MLRVVAMGIVILASACAYLPGVKQGGYLTAAQVDAVAVGTSREEVEFLLGPESMTDPADADKVLYFYTLGDDESERQQLDDLASTVMPHYLLTIEYAQQRVARKELRTVE